MKARHQHPLDAARAEVLRYGSLVASWKPEIIVVVDSAIAQSELDGLRDAVEVLRVLDPHAFRGRATGE